MDKKVVVETKGLVHVYPNGGVKALKGVDLKIYENDKVSIIGQNGSGKTTIVRHFNGLLRPTEGQVILLGEDTKDKSVGEMARRCGYVFQNPNHQIFCTSVQEELEVAPDNFGFTPEEKKKKIDEVVEMMNLGDILQKHPMTLDYTTKKIVTIASVLVFAPEILILDEPTGGLDEVGRRMLTRIINMMHDNGHTVIMISHDMDYVAENSERIVVMSQGEVIDDGTPEEIFLNQPILERAMIAPPQITSLDFWLDGKNKA
ncbi:MAG TPA: ABC transporter ATP-binding protein, partial [Methanocorpusculum sp.]|nr:ABC transporter ATP-binding protein [Methanocorpusculum sp.]